MKVRTADRKDDLIEQLTHYLERLSFNTDPRNWEILKWTLEFVLALRPQPLRLSHLSRISIGKGTAGKPFQASLQKLPLPTTMKDFVRADRFPHFLDVYGL